MRRIGFIREKNEIKYLVLYALSFAIEPLTYEDFADMAICDGGFGYFEFSDAVAELVESGHILVADRLYSITEKGRNTADALARALPLPVREEAQRSAARVGARIRRDAVVHTSHTENPDGTVTVRLAYTHGDETVFAAEIMVKNLQQAGVYEKNFRAHAERMYDGFLCVLLNDYRLEE